MDFADEASRVYDEWNRHAIDRLRRTDKQPVESALECEDCGDPIPEARRKAMLGCVTCVRCQALREEKQKR